MFEEDISSVMSDFQTFRSISWSTASYNLAEFLEIFTLPQLVKVHEGHFDPVECKTVGADDIYNLQAVKRVETVLLESTNGVETRIPVEHPCSIERVPEEFIEQALGLEDLTADKSTVKFVRVIQADPNFECLIKQGEKLKVKRKKSPGNFVTFRRMENEKHLLKVPTSCEASLQVLADGEELVLAKFLKKAKFPTYVRFITNSKDDDTEVEQKGKEGKKQETGLYKLPVGVVKVKGVFSDSFVTATTVIQGVISTVSFPKTLAICVVPTAIETKKNDPSVSLGLKNSQNSEEWQRCKGNTEEDQYEDMTGILKTTKELPSSKTPSVEVNREQSDRKTPISTLPRQESRLNTYTSAPSKVTRSNSLQVSMGNNASSNRQGSRRPDLPQRAMSFKELRVDLTGKEGQDHLYEELMNFKPSSGELKYTGATQRRRSEPFTDQQSKQTVKTFAFGYAEELEDKSTKGKMETVSVQTLGNLTPFNTNRRMTTFGREATTGETTTTSFSNDAESPEPESLNSQSHLSNHFPMTVSATSEAPVCISVALKQSSLFATQGKRSGEEGIPPVPSRQGSNKAVPPVRRDRPADNKAERETTANRNVSKTQADGEGTTKQYVHDRESPQGSNNIETEKARQPSSLREPCRPQDVNPVDVNAASTTRNPLEGRKPPVPLRNDHKIRAMFPEIPSKLNIPSESPAGPRTHRPVPIPREKLSGSKPASQAKTELVGNNKQSSASTSLLGKQSSTGTSCLGIKRAATLPADPPKKEDTMDSDVGVQRARSITAIDTKLKTSETQSMHEADSSSSFTIPKDLSTLRVCEVLKCLEALNMQHFVEIFKARQVDGSMLVCLDEEALESFGMDRFHRLKLLKVIEGYRPQL